MKYLLLRSNRLDRQYRFSRLVFHPNEWKTREYFSASVIVKIPLLARVHQSTESLCDLFRFRINPILSYRTAVRLQQYRQLCLRPAVGRMFYDAGLLDCKKSIFCDRVATK